MTNGTKRIDPLTDAKRSLYFLFLDSTLPMYAHFGRQHQALGPRDCDVISGITSFLQTANRMHTFSHCAHCPQNRLGLLRQNTCTDCLAPPPSDVEVFLTVHFSAFELLFDCRPPLLHPVRRSLRSLEHGRHLSSFAIRSVLIVVSSLS